MLAKRKFLAMSETWSSALLRRLRGAWRDLQVPGIAVRTRDPAPDLPDSDLPGLEARMRACLEARGGEVSARARAAELGRIYLSLSAPGRRRFLELLARQFDCDGDELAAAARDLPAAADRETARERLRTALEPPRIRLLTQLNALPQGTKFLVDVRADAIGASRDNVSIAGLERDLRRLLAAWFDVGFLELRQVTWDSPASLLEKLARYEAVHRVRGWRDLKNRLDSDRRIYAFFHPRMADEPLIFIEVALLRGIADSVTHLLDARAPVVDPRAADTAVFYSISNAQPGLAGISFGAFLIKRVVDQLSSEFPAIRTFVTLSPIPGFRAWIAAALAAGEDALVTPAERAAIVAALARPPVGAALAAALADDSWVDRPALAAALAAPLIRAAARYLAQAKRRDGQPVDAVARFHLNNGARVERLNWLADTSPKGMRESYGVMVNYLYDLADIEENHEAYAREGVVRVAVGVEKLASPARAA
jgi:malonyl-CoA decarboxylase